MKLTPSSYLRPHLEGCSPEERHLIQRGFRLGIQYTRDEIDAFIKARSPDPLTIS